jgi:hypothetical protein
VARRRPPGRGRATGWRVLAALGGLALLWALTGRPALGVLTGIGILALPAAGPRPRRRVRGPAAPVPPGSVPVPVPVPAAVPAAAEPVVTVIGPLGASLDVVVVVDLSAAGPAAGAPAHRLAVARRLVGLLGRGGHPDRVGVVLVRGTTIVHLPLTGLDTGAGRRAVDDALATRGLAPGSARSALAPALRHAAGLFGPSPALPLVVVVTDGPSDDTAAELARAVQAAGPGGVHLLATGTLPATWADAPVGSVSWLTDGPAGLGRLDLVVTKLILLAASRVRPGRTGAEAH